MMNKSQLAGLLANHKVERIAELSGLSEKTIYRIRQQITNPSIETVERLMDAMQGKRHESISATTVAVEGARNV